MFIVNDSGTICEELHSITIELRQDKTIVKKIKEKEKELENEYRSLPYSARLNTVEYYLENYVKKYKDVLNVTVICVNGKVFGIYSKESAEAIFQDIINALKRKEILFDLRDYEKVREKSNGDA